MKIVIAGAGEVGSHLAKLLSNEEQDILLIDENADKLAMLDASYNIMTMAGNPTSFLNLRNALRDGCDLFIAVMPVESSNIVACSIAKTLGAATTVARISHYGYMAAENRKPMKQMGVDRVIYPEYLAAQEIITGLKHPWTRYWFEFHDGKIILAGVRLREIFRKTIILRFRHLDTGKKICYNIHVSNLSQDIPLFMQQQGLSESLGDFLTDKIVYPSDFFLWRRVYEISYKQKTCCTYRYYYDCYHPGGDAAAMDYGVQ